MSTIITGIVLALIIGLPRFAFTNPDPYLRLFMLMNNVSFALALLYAAGMVGYMVGMKVGAGEFEMPFGPSDEFSLWLLAPMVVILAAQLFGLGILELSTYLRHKD